MNFNQRTTELMQVQLSPLNLDAMVRECDAIIAENPYIPSGYMWAIEYKRYQIELARGNTWLALQYLKRTIALNPYSDDLVNEYVRTCRRESPIEFVALIITSKKNEARALKLAMHLDASGIDYAIVTGNDTAPIVHERSVQVNVKDNYESLGRKVVAACTWVYENLSPDIGILKLDDDMLVENPITLRNKLALFKEHGLYAGLPSHMGGDHDRCRHWGKCEDPALNQRVYSRPYYRAWAEGDAYFMAAGVMQKLVLSLIRFPAQFEGEFYEDKLIGDVLMFEGVNLTALESYADMGMASGKVADDNEGTAA